MDDKKQDVVAGSGLTVGYGQKGESLTGGRRCRRSGIGWGLVVLVFLGGAAAYVYSIFGSLAVGLAYLQGERLVVLPRTIKVGELNQGEERQLSVLLANHTGKEVHIVGGGASCSCVALGRFPMTVPDGTSLELSVTLRGIGKPGAFKQVAQYFTDDEESPIIFVQFIGRLRENAAGS